MKNKFIGIKSLFAGALLAFSISSPVHAGIISIGNTKVSNPTNSENFDAGTVGDNITNQFANSGFTISTIGPAGISLTSNSVCGNINGGVTNKYLYMGINYPCSVNLSAVNAVSILFAKDVEELSWTGFNRASSSRGYTIQALNDGAVVSSLVFNLDNRFENKNVLFTGSVFDELRFTENGGYQGIFALDDLAWRSVPDCDHSEVPLPGTLPLLGVGMLGFGLNRKKKKTA